MKRLQIFFTIILLFSMFNVFGQVQPDGSITIQKLCEDCDTPGDEDGDGFADCEDLDCLYRQISSLKSDLRKSTSTCEVIEDILYDCFIHNYESKYFDFLRIKSREDGLAFCEEYIEMDPNTSFEETEEIQNDINICDSYAVGDGIQPGNLISQSLHRNKHDPPEIIADDMKYGVSDSKECISEDNQDLLDEPNETLCYGPVQILFYYW